MSSKIQHTLALLKPDIALNPIATKAVIDRILKNNVRIVKRKTVHWKKKDAEAFYGQHKGKFFYQRLLDYITCGPIIALVLAGQDSIQCWRDLMGPTKVFKANISHPYSLRGEFGLTDTRNSTHGSDSVESANQEIAILFGETLAKEPAIITRNKSNELSEKKTEFKWNESSINSSLGLLDTWSKFYTDNKSDVDFEWLASYTDIKDYILPTVKTALKSHSGKRNQSPSIIDIGCGDSMFGANIAKELENVDVFCVDFAIESLWRLQRKINDNSNFDKIRNCHFVHGNITEQQLFSNESICAVLDKGTTDSILKQPGGTELATKALVNIYNILCKGGVLIQITDEPPELRIDFLQETTKRSPDITFNISISCQQLTSDIDREYFLYTVSKR